ncbi:MAG: pentapeptide repeat-containing protein [Candidatus Heimdallarchaeota archaeon]|nr:pentapeptide repeat-containing protein [Candidatus Heimdallarchaeota archaeon]
MQQVQLQQVQLQQAQLQQAQLQQAQLQQAQLQQRKVQPIQQQVEELGVQTQDLHLELVSVEGYLVWELFMQEENFEKLASSASNEFN